MTADPALDAYVRPPDWRNPQAGGRYDLVVIGGGTAGLVSAAGAASLGARVALIERHRLGGDCLNTGCVPSKALLRAAADGVDFATAMRRLREARIALAPNDSAARLTSLGVELFFGSAAFTAPDAVAVAGQAIHFRRAVIATGTKPSVPSIAGLAERPYLTTDTLFDLSVQPADLLVLGGGAVGCEMAQAFARLGTRVTVVEQAPHLLPRDDPDAARIVEHQLERDGVRVMTDTTLHRLPPADAVLVATGRAPVLDDLGLAAAGVTWTSSGVTTDDHLRTSNRRIFAAGDIAGRMQFTHAADAMARIVVQNALFFGRKRVSDVVIPWCTFTTPEVAHVGVIGTQRGERIDTVTVPFGEVDRAVIDRATEGFVRMHHAGGRIRGATIVGAHAGELIGTVAVLMQQGGTLTDLAATVFPYPTLSLALKRAGDAYRRTALTPVTRTVLRYYFRRPRI